MHEAGTGAVCGVPRLHGRVLHHKGCASTSPAATVYTSAATVSTRTSRHSAYLYHIGHPMRPFPRCSKRLSVIVIYG